MNTIVQDQLITPAILQALPPRVQDSHKGNFGTVGIMGGAPNMIGAVMLCARAALHLGAGKVYAASLRNSIAVDFLQPEIMQVSPVQLLGMCDLHAGFVLAIGPGLGRSAQAKHLLSTTLQSSAIVVIDADALNLLAESTNLKNIMLRRTSPTVLTPHPGEAARLLGCDIQTLQLDRPAAALKLVEQYHAWVILKGAGSICAAPGGAWRVNPTGNPGLSSAGMGDVLTGIVAALLAQGIKPFAALQLAAYLHGAAADSLLMQGVGPVGLTASEVLVEARRLLNQRALSVL